MSEFNLIAALEELKHYALKIAECVFFLTALWSLCKIHLGLTALKAHLATRTKRSIHQLARFMVYLDRKNKNNDIHITD